MAERIAWARKHGVQPPAFAVAKARATGIDLAWLDGSIDRAKPKANCCVAQSSADKTCCEAELVAVPAAEKHSCCSKHLDIAAPDDSTPASDGNHLIGLRALACRGQALDWLAAVPTLIVPPLERLTDLPLIERRAPTSSEVAEGLSDSPDVPPPEVA